MTDEGTGRTSIEELTHRAVIAAREGRWDVVDHCYRERGSGLRTASLSREDRQRLLALDRQVYEQASVAHKVLASVLPEILAQHQRLRSLRSRLVGSAQDSTTLLWQT